MDNLFLSFLSMLFWSSVFTMVVYWGRKKKFFQNELGVGSVLILYLTIIVRLLLPFDFGLQRPIYMPGAFSTFYETVALKYYSLGPVSFTILQLLVVFWLGIALLCAMRYLVRYRKVNLRLSGCRKDTTESCQKAFIKVQKNTGKKYSVELLRSSHFHGPMSIGIFHRRILLPERAYTDTELYYILLHEYMHIRNGDLLLNLLSQICCCIFWWNPFAYLLRRELNQAMEMRCDLQVAECTNDSGKIEYLQTIVNSLKNTEKDKSFLNYTTAALIGVNRENHLVERFNTVAENRMVWSEKKHRIYFMYAVLFLLIGLSYTFVILPSFPPPLEDIIEGGAYEITPQNTYIRNTAEGEYELVNNGENQIINKETAMMMQEEGFEIR